MCTCSHESIRDYCAEAVVDFLSKLALTGASLKRALHGTREISQRLVQTPHNNIDARCGVATHSIEPCDQGVRVTHANGTELFDAVVIATQVCVCFVTCKLTHEGESRCIVDQGPETRSDTEQIHVRAERCHSAH
jgi:hypothetical protein